MSVDAAEIKLANAFQMRVPKTSLYIHNDTMHHVAMVEKELVAATSKPLILAILSEGDSYGYAIIQRVRELTDGELKWTDSMLYPVLHRLEKAGHVRSYWQTAKTGRKRKYYSVSKAGLAALSEKKRQWELTNGALGSLWGKAHVS